ncbi:MAG: SUMF1/EgtB/PvdO family nonheme iron enzyme, partial [Myxococcota bacterium]|nr:SUMF1/EgtB/PvdO family nonheme iron enzyme [Myxococcota bacterium]
RTGRRRIDPKEDSWSVPPSDLGVLSLSLDAEIDRLDGSVQVDGKSICTQLPCARHVKTGSHTVSVRVPDCDPWQRKVDTESLTNLKVQLSCRFGFVSLTAPDGAKVSFQKKDYEKQANGLYRLPTGSGTLKVFDDCHNGESKTTTLTSLSINKLTMGLGPKTTKSVTINVRDDAGKALSGRVFADNSALGSTPSVSVPICAKNVRVEIPARKRTKKVPFSTAKSTYELSLNNAVKGYKPILVRKGKFTMGDTWEDYWFRLPPRRVQITYDFYIMQSEVTQDLVTKVLNPGYQGWYVPNMPEKMDWVDAAHFANELSKREGLEPCYSITPNTEKPKKKLSSYQYPPNRKVVWKDKACTGWRLPTEAEWEYAAKGGSRNEKYKYAGSNNCSSVGWFAEELDDYEGPHTVCAKRKNSLGLCDMSGNFAEWIWGTQKKLVTQMSEEDKKEDNPIKRPILVDPIGWDPDEIYQEGDDPLVRGADLSKRCKEDIPYITSYRFSSQTGFRLVRRK